MDSFQSGVTTQSVLDQVMDGIRKNDLGSYNRLESDESKKYNLVKEIEKIVHDEMKHGKQLAQNGNDLTQLSLPEGRLEAIEKGLEMATYRFEIADREVKITYPDGTEFETIQLNTQANIDYAYYLQVASIILEGILLVLAVVGLKVPISKVIIKKASKELVEELVASSAFRDAIKRFLKSWKTASGVIDKAKALFYLLKDTYSLGILWNIIKTLFSNMGWWDWIKAAAVITAQIIAAFATGGLALIAKIALALKSAYDFIKKIANLQTLESMEPLMK